MLQFIRSKAGSFLVKILFVLLIGSFGIWGIGDFLRDRPLDATIISVGDQAIPGDQVQQEVNAAVERLRQQFGPSFDLAQARAQGVVDEVVDSMVNRSLLAQEAAQQNLVVGPKQIIATFEAEPAFKGANGQFDRIAFQSALAQANMTEASYTADLRSKLPLRMAALPATGVETAPKALAELLYTLRNESRVADWVYLPAGAAKDIPQPDDAALQAYYDAHHAAFTAPEFRGFTALVLRPADVANDVKITDDQLKDAYNQRLDEFTKKEKRHVLQMLLPDDKAAAEAAQELAAGKDFVAVAKDVAKQDPTTVDLGTVEKESLPAATAEAAFSAADGTVTQPIKGPFGLTILKIAGVEPGGVKTLAEVKPQIEGDLRKEAEGDALYKLSNKVEDALSGGADIAGIAQTFNLKPETVPAVDAAGKTPDGKPTDLPPVIAQALVKTLFATPQGQLSGVEEVKDGDAFFVVRTDGVTPPTLKPLDQVKDQVKDAWLAEQRTIKVAAEAKALSDAVKPGSTLAQVAGAQKLQVATTTPFTRSTRPGQVPIPAELISKLFGLKVGEVASAASPQGQYVAELKEIKPADAATDKNGVDAVVTLVGQDLSNELLSELEGALRQRYKVTIHRAALDHLFASGEQQ